ncbi:MAG: hypothetical protein AAB428_01845 [Patescibacteria group bacterium]
MIDLNMLNAGELYELGRHIGEASKERPYIPHRILLGVRDGMTGLLDEAKKDKSGLFNGYGFGDILWSLWGHWSHHLGNLGVQAPIPFVPPNAASGTGKI